LNYKLLFWVIELTSKIEAAKKFIVAESNQCVSCGLCLPHCPTYRLLKSEADSPRGRIALMNGVVGGHIPLNEKFVQHMNRCLTCRACEAVCPNHVSYGELIDQAKVLIVDSKSVGCSKENSIRERLLDRLALLQPSHLERIRPLFRLLQNLGLLRWLLKFDRVKKNNLFKYIAQLPAIKFPYVTATDKNFSLAPNHWQEVYFAEGRERGRVGLFLGCVARIADVATLNSSIFVLNRLGYTVHIPSQQTCCGALSQHKGELQQAAALARQNKSIFEKLKVDSIISTASGCGVQLFESGVGNQDCQVIDISQFLVTAKGWEDVKIAALPHKILVHDPCSLRNVLAGHAYAYQLISLIPDAQAISLAGNDQCCGAAGTYFIEQSEVANILREIKISAVMGNQSSYLVTSNIGCALFMADGLYEKDVNIEVMHPVTLLARQMGLQL